MLKFNEELESLSVLKERALLDDDPMVRSIVVDAIVQYYPDHPETLPLLKELAQFHEYKSMRDRALREIIRLYPEAIAQQYRDHSETLHLLKERAVVDDSSRVRHAAVNALGKSFYQESGMLDFLYDCAINDPFQRQTKWENNPR